MVRDLCKINSESSNQERVLTRSIIGVLDFQSQLMAESNGDVKSVMPPPVVHCEMMSEVLFQCFATEFK
jgi:hypothetical protein